MSEPCSGVWLGLVGQKGEAFLHRAVPLCDSEVIEQELYQVCQVTLQHQDSMLVITACHKLLISGFRLDHNTPAFLFVHTQFISQTL